MVKLSPSGQVLYSTYLGGSGADAGLGIAVDAKGNAYVLGTTQSTNFPTTGGAYQSSAPVQRPNTYTPSAFVTKLSADGSSLVYSTYVKGVQNLDTDVPGFVFATPVSPRAIALDAQGNVYFGGSADATAFPATAGAYSNSGGPFVAKLNAAGSALVFNTYLGGSGFESTRGIALDATGSIYAVGSTATVTFATTPGALHSAISSRQSGAFVVKLDPAGSHAIYSALVGGSNSTLGNAVAVDASGNAYIGGQTHAADFPLAASISPVIGGASDGFVTKLDAAGAHVLFSTFLGGSGEDNVFNVALDAGGAIYISGTTYSIDFPASGNALPKRFAGSRCLYPNPTVPFGTPRIAAACGDTFVTRITGAAADYSTYLSGSDADTGEALALAVNGSIWVAGDTSSSDFPTAGGFLADRRVPGTCVEAGSPSASQSYACQDGFISRIDFGAIPVSALKILNTASLIEAPIGPAEVVTLFGDGIGPSAQESFLVGADGRVPTTLSGMQVLFNGAPAPLLMVSASQITAIVPNAVSGSAHAKVSVVRQGQEVAAATVAVNSAAPALLTGDPSGSGQAAVVNADGTINSPSNPAARGSMISLYAVGIGATSDGDGAVATVAKNGSGVQVVIGNGPLVQANVVYAGPSPGLISAATQINVQLPLAQVGIQQVSGDRVPIYILDAGLTSQAGMTVAIAQ